MTHVKLLSSGDKLNEVHKDHLSQNITKNSTEKPTDQMMKGWGLPVPFRWDV